MSSHRSDILENMAPALAPESTSRRDSALRGVWSYRDGHLERLVWHGRDEQGREVESAIETAVWLFEERHQEGDRKTIETDHGTAVLERGSQGVVVAWYENDHASGRKNGAGVSQTRDQGGPRKTRPQDQEQDDGREGANSVEPRRSDATPAQNTTSKEPVSIDLAKSQPPVDRSEQQVSGRSRTDSPARSQDQDPHHAPVAASSRHARPDNVPEGSCPKSDAPPNGRQPSEEFHVQISFADSESDDNSDVDSTTEITCRWADLEDHLNQLTEMACEHLGSPVVMNYWRDVIGEYDTLENGLDIDLYGTIEARNRETILEDETLRRIETVCHQWLERCERSLPAEAELLESPPDPPWRA